MKIIEDEADIEGSECRGLIVTGDGDAETHRLDALAHHFDEDDVLAFPHGSKTPVRHTRTDANPTLQEELKGISTLEGLQHRLNKYESFIVVIDREYIDHHDDIKDEMTSTLDTITPANTDFAVTQHTKGTYQIDAEGPIDFTVYATFVGREIPYFEDRMRCLLNDVRGLDIPPTVGDDIKCIVDEQLGGWNERKTFIRERDRAEIEAAFPDLSKMFHQIE